MMMVNSSIRRIVKTTKTPFPECASLETNFYSELMREKKKTIIAIFGIAVDNGLVF